MEQGRMRRSVWIERQIGIEKEAETVGLQTNRASDKISHGQKA